MEQATPAPGSIILLNIIIYIIHVTCRHAVMPHLYTGRARCRKQYFFCLSCGVSITMRVGMRLRRGMGCDNMMRTAKQALTPLHRTPF